MPGDSLGMSRSDARTWSANAQLPAQAATFHAVSSLPTYSIRFALTVGRRSSFLACHS